MDRYSDLAQALLEDCGPPQAEFFRRFPEFEKWREKSPAWWMRAADELDRESERGLRFLLREDPQFPPSLMAMQDPPWALCVKGNVECLRQASISVVGAREPATASVQWMEEHLAEFLTDLPLAVVSGGARGIDQAAHRIAIRAGRPTQVYLPSGVGCLYPSDLQDWVLPVIESGGAFVSEFHPRTPMRKWYFQARNRLIAGISPITLVVQARTRSGTWLTARQVLEENRGLAVLPGSPWDGSFSGNLELLTQGGVLVRNAQDLLIFLNNEMRTKSTDFLALGDLKSAPH